MAKGDYQTADVRKASIATERSKPPKPICGQTSPTEPYPASSARRLFRGNPGCNEVLDSLFLEKHMK